MTDEVAEGAPEVAVAVPDTAPEPDTVPVTNPDLEDPGALPVMDASGAEPEPVVAGAVEVTAPLLPLALGPETGAPAVPVAVTTGVETPTVAEVAPEDDPESEPGILD